MKKVLKGVEPPLLATYRKLNPANSWEEFKNSRARRNQAQNQLIMDQGGLCAYCEVDLKPGRNSELADLRVEHVHPKSDNSQRINWHLKWTNLLACCHGGSNSNVIDAAERHTSPDHSCDVPKGNHDWDNTILNPLHLPASPPAFKYQRIDGAIQVDKHNCGVAGIDPVKAQGTINYLRLDAERLRNLRKGELNRINDLLRKEIQNGLTVPEARKRLAEALLQKNDHHHWPKFFTAIRCYLGSAAEDQLRVIAFDG